MRFASVHFSNLKEIGGNMVINSFDLGFNVRSPDIGIRCYF